VVVPGPNGSVLYFFCNIAGFEGWYDGSYHPAGSVAIPTGSAFYIKRKTPNAAFDWVIPAE
jgi:hypothetical protein